MKHLLASILFIIAAAVGARAEIKCSSATNYYFTRVVVSDSDPKMSSRFNNPVLCSNGRQLSPIAMKTRIVRGRRVYDMLFPKIKDMSELSLNFKLDGKNRRLNVGNRGGIDEQHPVMRFVALPTT